MYFTFDCPECQKQLKVPSDAAGRKARCPYCKHSLVVPESPEPEESPVDQDPPFPGSLTLAPRTLRIAPDGPGEVLRKRRPGR